MGVQRRAFFYQLFSFFLSFLLSGEDIGSENLISCFCDLRGLYPIVDSAEIKYSYLFEADDALLGVPICRYGERVGSLRVDDAVLDVCVDAQVFVVGFDLPHWFAYLGRFGDVELVVFCR